MSSTPARSSSRTAEPLQVGAEGAAAAQSRTSERAGYPIRVALIAGREDLGAVTVALGEAEEVRHASSVIELSFIYKGPLLIVMPSGIGFAHFKHGTAPSTRRSRALPVAGGGTAWR